MLLAPRGFHFAQFKDYTFHDPLREDRKTPEPQSVDLGEKTTDAEGKATVDLDLERFADSTYEMTLTTEGFEAEGGRSVTAYNSLLVSALPRVIGYKADCELNYVPKDSPHFIDFIAIDPALQKVPARQTAFQPHRANLRLDPGKKGERQLRLRVGPEGASCEIGGDFHRR